MSSFLPLQIMMGLLFLGALVIHYFSQCIMGYIGCTMHCTLNFQTFLFPATYTSFTSVPKVWVRISQPQDIIAPVCPRLLPWEASERHPRGILTRCLNHLNCLLSAWMSIGTTLISGQMSEFLTLSQWRSPATLWRKLMSAPDPVLLVITQSTWPTVRFGM